MTNSPKKRLLCYITHSPLFESCFPILERLHKRGLIHVDLVVASRMRKTDPGIIHAFEQAGMEPRFQSRANIELFSYFDIKRADAVLSHSDPYAYRKASRLRDTYLPTSRTPSIFVQHGMLQSGVNWELDQLGNHWYAELLLWWDAFDPEVSHFVKDDIADRVRKVGFIKKNTVPTRVFSTERTTFFESFKQRLLICTNFPDQTIRFDDDTQGQYYQIFDDFCARNPDVLLMLRAHRGKQNTVGKPLDEILACKYRNVIIMDRYSGDFAYSSIHDGLSICDGMISHASTAVLDGLYSGKPTGVLDNRWADLNSLPSITSLERLEAFSNDLDEIDPRDNDVVARFGDLESNLDLAAVHIEALMSQGGH